MIVEVSEKSTVGQVRRQLDRENYDKARELAETHGWFLARQFENEANPDMHSKTTAEEIIADRPEGGPFAPGRRARGPLMGARRRQRSGRQRFGRQALPAAGYTDQHGAPRHAEPETLAGG